MTPLIALAIVFAPLALFGWLLCAYEASLEREYDRDRRAAWRRRRWR